MEGKTIVGKIDTCSRWFTCAKLVLSEAKGLHLQLEGVDGQSRHHVKRLLLAAHVREAQGSPKVVQAAVTCQKGL